MRPEADAEWADAATSIPGMFYWTSGEAPEAERWNPMDPSRGLNRPSPVGLPSFVDRDDMLAAIGEFQRNGFHGPLNYYRAMQAYFDEAGAFAGAVVAQPSFFAFGEEDGMVKMRRTEEVDLRKLAPGLCGFLSLNGIGHWPQLEATDRVNEALLGFLREVS